ncbi:hypothetical protein [Chryseoglobus sp. 28M-23]|uniref:type IV pilus modification PilV family protein n=1 Tax=Chryseoglobus sp. 28M-23 TaxID=2772253 RepID=UPI001746AF8A|nr:hypothetical protein [Chryseoglobus sp. 28M-23]QOD93845.1 hypothetical protein IE160_00970 [Chryseoglobus sp. 28M-23]
MSIERSASRPVDERGLGLLEIVISMFLISLIAISFIPVLVSGLRASEANSTIATATRLVAQVTDRALDQAPNTCAALQILGGTSTQVDAQGVTIEVVTTVPDLATCVEKSTNLVRVVAQDASDGSTLAESRTLLFLPGTSP